MTVKESIIRKPFRMSPLLCRSAKQMTTNYTQQLKDERFMPRFRKNLLQSGLISQWRVLRQILNTFVIRLKTHENASCLPNKLNETVLPRCDSADAGHLPSTAFVNPHLVAISCPVDSAKSLVDLLEKTKLFYGGAGECDGACVSSQTWNDSKP